MPGPWFFWALFGLALIGAETFIPGLAIIFFGIGALAVSVFSLLPFFSAHPALQALMWIACSFATLGFLRRPFMRLLKGSVFYRISESELESLAGELAEVTEPIRSASPGRVKCHGTSWKAVAYLESFEPGQQVRVVSREGLALVVTRDFLDAPSTDLVKRE